MSDEIDHPVVRVEMGGNKRVCNYQPVIDR
jgi:hypothetical protein